MRRQPVRQILPIPAEGGMSPTAADNTRTARPNGPQSNSARTDMSASTALFRTDSGILPDMRVISFPH